MVKKQLFVVPYDGQVASVVEYVEDPETKQTAVGQWDSDALGWASIVAADDCWRSTREIIYIIQKLPNFLAFIQCCWG
jgi:hypothetical protein